MNVRSRSRFGGWQQARPLGFTLVEILTVMTIVLIILALVVPAVHSALEGSRITQALIMVQSSLSEARQQTTSLDRAVEVRFCRSTVAGAKYTTIQKFQLNLSGTMSPTGSVRQLPVGMCVSSISQYSSLMTSATNDKTPASNEPGIAGMGHAYTYREVRFLPSTGTDLAPSSLWFVTIMSQINDSKGVLPSNYATVQIDPVDGMCTVQRP